MGIEPIWVLRKPLSYLCFLNPLALALAVSLIKVGFSGFVHLNKRLYFRLVVDRLFEG
jgi:hypothetical protein